MNRQTTFQMPKQNFKVLVETHRDGAENIMYGFPGYRICYLIIFLPWVISTACNRLKKWNFHISEFLASCWVSLLPSLVSFSTSVALSLKCMNALPTHSAADVILFPGTEHQQGNVNAEQQIRCTLTSVQSHAVITSGSFCESKPSRLIIFLTVAQSPRRQQELETFKEIFLFCSAFFHCS